MQFIMYMTVQDLFRNVHDTFSPVKSKIHSGRPDRGVYVLPFQHRLFVIVCHFNVVLSRSLYPLELLLKETPITKQIHVRRYNDF